MTSPDDDSREAIIRAAFRAIDEYGYAELTIQRIADEFTKSKSLLYYHFDGKDEILRALLDFSVDRFLAVLDDDETDDAAANLHTVIAQLLPADPSEEALTARRVILELRGRAVVDAEFCAAFSAVDSRLRDRVERYLTEGVERGQFTPHDSTAVATHFVTVLNGALLESVTTTRSVTGPARETLTDRIEQLETHP